MTGVDSSGLVAELTEMDGECSSFIEAIEDMLCSINGAGTFLFRNVSGGGAGNNDKGSFGDWSVTAIRGVDIGRCGVEPYL